MTWTHKVHFPGLQGGVCLSPSPSPTWWCTRPWVHMLSHLGARTLAAAWPMTSWVPHTGSRKYPEMESCPKQAKLCGWGLWPFSSHLQAPEDCTFNWSRISWHWLLSWSCWEDGLWDRSLPFSQVKTSFLTHQHLSHKSGFCGSRQMNLHFVFVWLHRCFIDLDSLLFHLHCQL